MSQSNCEVQSTKRIGDFFCTDANDYQQLACINLQCYDDQACTSSSYLPPGHLSSVCTVSSTPIGRPLYCLCCVDPNNCEITTTQIPSKMLAKELLLNSNRADAPIIYMQEANELNEVATRTDIFTASPNDAQPGLPTGAIVAIAVLSVLLVLTLVIIGFLLFRRVRDRRKNKGQYRPKDEEDRNVAKYPNLPYLTPPAIEGLI